MSPLHTSVLILNQNYEPLNVCNARRAFVLIGRGKAEVIEESERLLRSVSRAFRVPSVIRMIYFIRRPRPIARLARQEVFTRDRFTCQYCGKYTRDLTLDHVIPRYQGGPHSWENLAAACRACNHRKAGRTPAQAHMRLLRHPRRPHVTLLTTFARHVDQRPAWRIFFPGADHPYDSSGLATGS